MNLVDLWQAVLANVELKISRPNFNTWFKNTQAIEINNDTIKISVPNIFAKEWLEKKFNREIINAVNNLTKNGFVKKVEGVISPSVNVKNHLKNKQKGSINTVNTALAQQPINLRSSYSAYTQAKTDFRPSNKITHIDLNPRYTFDNFIVGSNNELAKAACEAVARNLGRIYNPLFIYGGVGLGKTHLLQSIGNFVSLNHPDKNIIYSTSERFTNHLVDLVKSQNIRNFKDPYLAADLLIIDDIQFIAGKEKTQEEFFHIFNTLYQLNKQIVLSSDRPPKEIATLEERLRSRFEGGMIADITKPDLETRIAILEKKANEKNFEVSRDVLEFIAQNINQNIRELEGALNRLIAYCELEEIIPNVSNTKRILGDLIKPKRKKGINIKNILQAVAEFYDLDYDSITKRSRRKDIVKPRQIAMYLMRSELRASYPSIGIQFGGRDHTTAIHAYEKISSEIESDEQLEQDINLIRKKIFDSLENG